MSHRFRHIVCVLLFLSSASADEPTSTAKADLVRDRILHELNDDDLGVVTDTLRNLELATTDRKLTVKDALAQLVLSETVRIARDAIEILGQIGPRAASALPALSKRLTASDPEIRIAAATAIWRISKRPEPSVAVLLKAMADDDEDTSSRATWTFQEMGPQADTALLQLTELTSDSRSHVRRNAATALGVLGPGNRSKIEGLLQRMLTDSSGGVQIAAATAIGNVDGSLDEAVRVLSAIVLTKPKDKSKKENIFAGSSLPSAAAEALGNLKGDAAPATHALAQALSSPYLDVRLASAEALGQIGPAAAAAAIPELAKAMRDTETHSYPFAHHSWCVGDNATTALTRMGAAAVPVLIEATTDTEPDVRVDAVRALGSLPSASAATVGPLAQALQDEHPLVRIEAAKSLRKLGSVAVAAAPQLVPLLFDDRAYTSFRGGSGIGHKESVRDQARLALQQIKPPTHLILQAFVQATAKATFVPYEAIVTLRDLNIDSEAIKKPLERLLSVEGSEVGAAAALAIVDPDRDGLRTILEKEIFRRRTSAIAATGLSSLAEPGYTFDDQFCKRLRKRIDKKDDLFSLCFLLRMDPGNKMTANLLVEKLREAHGVFDAIGIREAEQTLKDLSGQQSVREVLLAEMKFTAEASASSEFFRIREQANTRLSAARILMAAKTDVEQAVKCLCELAAFEDVSVQGEVADILGTCSHETLRQSAIEAVIPLLDIEEGYVVDGDFYGNGGERYIVGDRAALALTALKATSELRSLLHGENIDVRVRAVRALGDIGDESATDDLLQLSDDVQFRIRRATMTALGKIGEEHAASREKLSRHLEDASKNDRRLSVRNAAAMALNTWH